MSTDEGLYSVGEAARIAHVSVRALHHYDELGLLRPSRRSPAGYRLYATADLERLQQVLFYRELGFELGRIRDLMADPSYERREALREQRRQLAERALRLEAMSALIDRTLASLEGRTDMTDEELFEVFGDFDPAEYEDDARERWGGTDTYRESARRTRACTKDDWARYREESDTVNEELAELMRARVAADDARATHVAERHRLLIDRWFYPCPPEMHTALGAMYVADPRFAATYERVRPGLARYLRDAIAANAARA